MSEKLMQLFTQLTAIYGGQIEDSYLLNTLGADFNMIPTSDQFPYVDFTIMLDAQFLEEHAAYLNASADYLSELLQNGGLRNGAPAFACGVDDIKKGLFFVRNDGQAFNLDQLQLAFESAVQYRDSRVDLLKSTLQRHFPEDVHGCRAVGHHVVLTVDADFSRRQIVKLGVPAEKIGSRMEVDGGRKHIFPVPYLEITQAMEQQMRLTTLNLLRQGSGYDELPPPR